jgi:hypothetical protein
MKSLHAHDAIRRALIDGPHAKGTPSKEVAHCCALISRVLDTILRHVDTTVQLTGDGGTTVSLTCADIDRTWHVVSRTLAARDPALFLYSHHNVEASGDWVRFDMILPVIGCVNVRARFIAVERAPRFCCRVCRTAYGSLLNARSCRRAHSTEITGGASAPEPPVPGRRARMVAHWNGLSRDARRDVAAYALDDLKTVVKGTAILDIHRAVLDAVCGVSDGEVLVAALEHATEGTMLLPGFGTGDAVNPNPNNLKDCEAIVAWWTAARLASDAMATAVLSEVDVNVEPPAKKTKMQKKPKKTTKKAKKYVPEICVPEEIHVPERKWSEMYSFPDPAPGEFDPMAAIRFLERRAVEVLGY